MYGLENQYDNVGRLIDTSIAVTTPGVTRTGRATRDQLIGSNGDDTIVGGFGADILTGGPGADTFVYNSLRDARDVITDFTPYADKIKLTNLLQSLGVNSNEVDVFEDGYILIKDITGGVALQIDRDGWFGRARPSTLVFIRGLTAAQIAPARDLILSEPVSSR